ncbi:non-lysosomal glucosylceramidase [Draconibacterium sp.]|nr:non-lysosomal glucosylceramidase [Draconibacterium sp.]
MNQKLFFCVGILIVLFACQNNHQIANERAFNSVYEGEYLNRLAFPIGGIGSGMFCLEGTGAISHVSVRNHPNVFNEPFTMAALSVKGLQNGAKVLEGPVPDWKIFGNPGTGNGAGNKSYGFPRFEKVSFETKFPFGKIELEDKDIPMDVSITGWSPFIPTDEDNSSLPVGGMEYTFKNTGKERLEACFSYHAENFMRMEIPSEWGGRYEGKHYISGINNGILLQQECLPDKPHFKGDYAIVCDDPNTITDLCWFRGGWFDSRTVLWKDLSEFTFSADTTTLNSPGASLYVPFNLAPGEEKTIRVMMSWYVPHSNLRVGLGPVSDEQLKTDLAECEPGSGCCADLSDIYYEPWYSGRFKDINEVVKYWKLNYNDLRSKSKLFSNAFYGSSLPGEVIEAVAANLTILKSPTVLRQKDGKLWAWEGCHDGSGCCHGSCTHVWNYAQAISHLFPALERSLRETEYEISQNEEGHQSFRSTLPIKPEVNHLFHAASDGQLGGMIKVYRDWRISGDTKWLQKLYPKVKRSLDYCIEEWDPRHRGVLEEPHHNTYDIEFWGPDGMCTSFYLGALAATIEMGNALGEDVSAYQTLLGKGKEKLETELYNGEYFIQKITVEGLRAKDPVAASKIGINMNYSHEAIELLQKEGPKYQYGNGCLSDGILGAWMGKMAGLEDFVDRKKVLSHLNSIYKYNLKTDLSDHINPQRPTYGMGKEGGLLLCTWPNGDNLTLPFVYSNEVWTGIEYQVASHLMCMGEVEKGLEIVKEVRKRYDGKTRNPFNEYECGHWYARAMASYGLLQGLTGVRYDAVDEKLYVDSRVGDFTSFLSTEYGFGTVEFKNGEAEIDVVYGEIPVEEFVIQ